MKRFLLLMSLAVMIALPMYGDWEDNVPQFTQDVKAKYRLFQTRNMNIYLLLNTATGQVDMVQWSTSGNQLRLTLSDRKRVYSEEDEILGRFTLYATTNFYNFIMVDQIDGRTWQVQWSTEPGSRMVLPIN